MLNDIFPNLARGQDELITCTMQTLQMMLISGAIAFIFGLLLGIILIVTKRGGILQNLIIYNILDKFINVVRSIPYLILMVLLIPLSRKVLGTGIGVMGAIIPLACGTIPFFARQIETALEEVDDGLIEASLAMGLSPIQIITRVYLRESIPTITRVTMITFVNLLGLTAMAGAVGAGGLGDFAIRYGNHLQLTDLLWLTIGIILIFVSIIQFIGNTIIKHTTH